MTRAEVGDGVEAEFGGMVDFGIVNVSGGSGEVRLALVVVKTRNDRARPEFIKCIVKIYRARLLFMTFMTFMTSCGVCVGCLMVHLPRLCCLSIFYPG